MRCAALLAALLFVNVFGCDESTPRPPPAASVVARSSTVAPAALAAPAPAASSVNRPPAAAAQVASGNHARRVLHFGDSMVPLVGNYLRPLYTKRGAGYEMVSTHSSTTRTWAAGNQLSEALARYEPDLVLISLGSNELFDSDLPAIRAAVTRIVSTVGDRRCLWIGPPAWAKDRGFSQVVREHAGPCRYFDSTRLKFARQEDGRHPDWSSSHRWATAVYRELGGTEPVPSH